LIDRSID